MRAPCAAGHTRASSHLGSRITPVLAALHWLPLSFRIDFKISLLVLKALNGQPPACISQLLVLYKPDGCLRSSSKALLCVPKSRLANKR